MMAFYIVTIALLATDTVCTALLLWTLVGRGAERSGLDGKSGSPRERKEGELVRHYARRVASMDDSEIDELINNIN